MQSMQRQSVLSIEYNMHSVPFVEENIDKVKSAGCLLCLVIGVQSMQKRAVDSSDTYARSYPLHIREYRSGEAAGCLLCGSSCCPHHAAEWTASNPLDCIFLSRQPASA